MSILVGKRAPDFTTQAVKSDGTVTEDFNFGQTIEGKYAVLFFYPLDFTFVCPTELIAMDKRMDKFNELGVEVAGVSIDSHWTHNAWRKTPVDDGIGEVRYTLAADMNHAICKPTVFSQTAATPTTSAGRNACHLRYRPIRYRTPHGRQR